jgi:hypothetical protein
MPILVDLYAPFAAPIESVTSSDWLSDLQPVVTPELPEIDGCRILGRTKAYLVDQGVVSTLQHVMRDRKNKPIDLTGYFAPAVSDSDSESDSDSDGTATVVLRVKEILGSTLDSARNIVWEVQGAFYDTANGVVRAQLTPTMVEEPGVYELSWGIRDGSGIVVLVDRGLLSVEKSQFAKNKHTVQRGAGPITIRELREEIMDTCAAENLLLEGVEFGDEQIIRAIVEPIRLWNETPPPIKTFTTRDFPFRGNWKSAAIGYLMQSAAQNYRRNHLPASAGGVTIDDKNKEREYIAEAQRRLAEYKQWLIEKKFSINAGSFGQSHRSQYGRYHT